MAGHAVTMMRDRPHHKHATLNKAHFDLGSMGHNTRDVLQLAAAAIFSAISIGEYICSRWLVLYLICNHFIYCRVTIRAM